MTTPFFSRTPFRIGAVAAILAGTAATGPAFAQGTVRQQAVGCASPAALATGPSETAEAILPDGTSVILAPGGAARVSCDAEGRAVVTLTSGLMRVAGRGVTVIAGETRMTLVGGAAVVEAGAGGTRAHLVGGQGLRIAAGGAERLIWRPGFQVVEKDGRLSQPRRIAAAALVADILRLSEGLRTGIRPRGSAALGGTGSGATVQQARAEAGTGDDDGSLDPEARITAPVREVEDDTDSETDPEKPVVVKPVDPEPPVVPITPFTLVGAFGGTGTLGPTTGSTQAGIVNEATTTSSYGNFIRIRQNYADTGSPSGRPSFASPLNLGPVTNRLLGDGEATVSGAQGASVLPLMGAIEGGVAYYYAQSPRDNGGLSIPLIRDQSASYYYSSQVAGLVKFQDMTPVAETGLVRTSTFHGNAPSDISSLNLVADRADTTFGSSLDLGNSAGDSLSPGVWNTGTGAFVTGLNFATADNRYLLMTPTEIAETPARDNFIFLDLELVRAINWFEISCTDCAGAFAAAVFAELESIYGTAGAQAILALPEPQRSSYLRTKYSSYGDGKAAGAALIADPGETRRYIFASGELDGVAANRVQSARIDSFYLSAGMEGVIATDGVTTALVPGMDTSTGSRAFLRAESWTELAPAGSAFGTLSTSQLSQTPLSIVYSGDNLIPVGADTTVDKPKVFYADLGFSSVGRQQISTISATIGSVTFRYGTDLNGEEMVDAILDLTTTGSSRGVNAAGASLAAIGFSGDLLSTAAGGGNPNLDSDGTAGADPGRLGFFVLENAGEVFDDVATATTTLAGGIESPVGGTGTTNFALLRLGVATGSTPITTDRGGLAGYTGYASAILDIESGGSVVRGTFGALDIDAATTSSANLAFTGFDEATSSFTASLGTATLGGATGASAYVDAARFGASSADGKLALISGATPALVDELVTGAVVGAAQRETLRTTMQSYDHVKWGYFFGDMPGAGARQHAATGTWAAGATTYTAAQPGEVTANYQGHAIGNVSNGANVYTAAGIYRDTYDAGRANKREFEIIGFDGQTGLTGKSEAVWGSDGSVGYKASFDNGTLSGELNGSFVGPEINGNPAGVVGAFTMWDGAAGSYRATGSFAGEQVP